MYYGYGAIWNRMNWVIKNNKHGERPFFKDSLATEIAQALGLSEGDADSLTKANKLALQRIADFIRNERS